MVQNLIEKIVDQIDYFVSERGRKVQLTIVVNRLCAYEMKRIADVQLSQKSLNYNVAAVKTLLGHPMLVDADQEELFRVVER